jgi:hypothetical protein
MTPGFPLPRPLIPRSKSTWVTLACSAVWLLSTVGGLAFLWTYENTPGTRLAVPASWPAGSQIPHAAGTATLVMFAHPRCPCTRASVDELTGVLEQYPGRAQVYVVFYKPRGAPDGWALTDLWRSAAAIPGVDVRCDENGVEAARFGATTSGSVLFYDAGGKLQFDGGITAERGHAGDNDGLSAIVALLNRSTPSISTMPVLGCSLLGPHSTCKLPGALSHQ